MEDKETLQERLRKKDYERRMVLCEEQYITFNEASLLLQLAKIYEDDFDTYCLVFERTKLFPNSDWLVIDFDDNEDYRMYIKLTDMYPFKGILENEKWNVSNNELRRDLESKVALANAQFKEFKEECDKRESE